MGNLVFAYEMREYRWDFLMSDLLKKETLLDNL